MIRDLILENTLLLLVTGIIICLITLSLILREQIKSNRRYKLKERHLKKSASLNRMVDKTDSKKMPKIISGKELEDSEKESNYKSTFIRPNKLKMRQCVYIDQETHAMITQFIGGLSDKDITIGGFIDNILKNHLVNYQSVINELHRKRKNIL